MLTSLLILIFGYVLPAIIAYYIQIEIDRKYPIYEELGLEFNFWIIPFINILFILIVSSVCVDKLLENLDNKLK